MPEGTSQDFRTKDATENAPLAAKLFEFPYVKGVFYMSNFITITKDDATDWYEVKGEIQNLIKS